MRELGISAATLKDGSFDDFLRIIKNAGFEYLFCGNDPMRIKAAQKAGLMMDNLHAPFDGINNMWLPGEEGEQMLARLKDTVDTCAAYDIPKTVIHLSSGLTPPRINDLGYKRFNDLVEYAVKKGVRPAFENQRMLANLAFMMEEYKDVPEVGFCWDTGHELCFTNGREYMPLFGNRLICVHIQDNHGVFNQDQHLLPFDGKVDWEKAARNIKNSPYDGPLMLETWYRTPDITGFMGYEEMTSEQYYARAYAAAERLRTMIENA